MTVVERRQQAALIRGRVLKLWLAAAPVALAHAACRFELVSTPRALALWLELGYAHWVLAGVLIALLGLGQAAFRASGLLRDLPLSRSSALALYLGAGLVATTAVLLPAAAAGTLPVGVGLWVALAGGAVVLCARGGGPERRAIAADGPAATRQERGFLLPAVVILLALPYWLQTLLPNSDFDAAAHHLPMASHLLANGFMATDPLYPPSCYPGAIHLVYALLVGLGAGAAVAPFNLVLSAACVLAVFALAHDLWGRDVARISALTAATVNLLWELGLDARIDNALAFAVTVAVHAFLRWERCPDERSMLVVSGAMLGLAMGIKSTAGFVLLGLALPVVALVAARWRRPDARCRAAFGLALVLVAVPHGAWYARNAIQWGDPLYPQLRGTVYVAEDGEARPLAPALAALEQRLPPPPEHFLPTPEVVDNAHIPSLWNWWQVVNGRALVARKVLHWVSPFPVLVLLLPLVVRQRSSFLIVLVAGVFYAITAENSYLVRYVLPVLPLMCAGAGAVLARPRPRAWRILVAVVLWAFVAVNAGHETRKLAASHPWGYLSGAQDALLWLEGVGYNRDTQVIRVLRRINVGVAAGAIDADETIYMVGEGRAHLLACRWIPDTSATAQRWASELVRADGDLDRIRDAFERRGIRWILFYPGRYALTRRESPSRRVYEAQRFVLHHFSQFIRRHGRVVHIERPSGMTLLLLKRRPEPELLPPGEEGDR
jgi:4-amino-4-deoxy-L-arabinose transferase-like glycosyltransferase